jgi:single-stranded DNA-binding protein
MPSEMPAQAAREHQEKQRVEITGRIGKLPTFKETTKGIIAKFPVAEHVDDTTRWHTIVAFGKHAEALRDSLTLGEEVKVIGYSHERQAGNKKDGTPKKVREIYLAGLKHAQKKE